MCEETWRGHNDVGRRSSPPPRPGPRHIRPRAACKCHTAHRQPRCRLSRHRHALDPREAVLSHAWYLIWLPTRHSTWMAPTLLTAPPPMGSGRALPRSVVAAKSPSSFLPGWHKRRPVYKIIRPTIRDLRYHGRPRPHRRGCGATRGCAVTDLACGPRAGRDQLGESGTSHRFFITETRSTVYIRSRKHIQNRQGHK